MSNKWLYDDLTALELFELAAEHPDMLGLFVDWIESEDDAERAAIFCEMMALAEELVCEIELDPDFKI